jgi:hypothetical protein
MIARRELLLGAVFLAAGGFLDDANAATWVLLGARNVDWLVDHDVIHVGAAGRFDKILLKVKGNGLFLYDLKVVYGNGGVDDIPVRVHIPQGGSTRVIDLRGGDRRIDSIAMTYQKPVDGGGPTTVEVWGQR